MDIGEILALLPQQIVFGLALGAVYALLAVGYTMVYGVLFMINFAHGDVPCRASTIAERSVLPARAIASAMTWTATQATGA